MNRQHIINAMVANPTVRTAAKAAGVSERTIFNLLHDATFQVELEAAQGEIWRGLRDVLLEAYTEAVRLQLYILTREPKLSLDARLRAADTLLSCLRKTNFSAFSGRLDADFREDCASSSQPG